MKRALSKFFSQPFKRDRFVEMLLDEAAHRLDASRLRRQARYPARSACSGRRKNRTFSRRGRRAGHEGRQYTPVDDTANTKHPSWLESRTESAFQRASSAATGLG